MTDNEIEIFKYATRKRLPEKHIFNYRPQPLHFDR